MLDKKLEHFLFVVRNNAQKFNCMFLYYYIMDLLHYYDCYGVTNKNLIEIRLMFNITKSIQENISNFVKKCEIDLFGEEKMITHMKNNYHNYTVDLGLHTLDDYNKPFRYVGSDTQMTCFKWIVEI